MKNERLSQLLFFAATAVALLVYWLTAPETLPWGLEARMAGGAQGLSALPNAGTTAAWRIWGYFVEIFAGNFVALAYVVAAIAAGCLAMLVNRYFGWRVAAAAALVWTFLPAVWNATALGLRSVCVASGIVLIAWELERLAYRVLRRARTEHGWAEKTDGGLVETALPSGTKKWYDRIAWGALGVAAAVVLTSVVSHDYQLGKSAGAYARGIVREAGDRIIVLNGVADEQVVWELAKTSGEGEQGILRSVSSERGYRPKAFTAQVRAEWPEQTNYWIAAEIGPGVFLRVAMKEYGANFYRMDGRDSTLAGWERRWNEAKKYLASSDPFVPVMRRVFAYEGNAVANAICDGEVEVEGRGRQRTDRFSSGEARCLPHVGAASCRTNGENTHSTATTNNYNYTLAWQLYRRIYDEVDPGNFAALVNQCEMIRRGYKVSEDERRRVNRLMEEFFSDPVRRQHAREIARASGSVRSDPELIARLEAEARARMREKLEKGELTELPRSWMTLIEWSNEMITSVGRGDRAKAAKIARAILANEQWGGFIPANAILGSATAAEGDYVAAEAFFKTATATTNAVPSIVLNDYAHTLMCLGKLDEAEKVARRAVAADKNLRIARRTLGEILDKRRKGVKKEGTK